MFGTIGLPELIVIALILLLLVGHKRLGGLGTAMGSFIRNFREGLQGEPPRSSLPPRPEERSVEEREEQPGRKIDVE
jgi:sec-independent protein translocase protein TatA